MTNNDLRFEKKMTLSRSDREDFFFWLKAKGIEYSTAYPSRFINNIYFDDPTYSAYNQNSSGSSRRSKCRLRWYGDIHEFQKPQFEVKIKANQLGHKKVCYIESDIKLNPVLSIYKRLRDCLEEPFKDYLDKAHKPMVFNRYYRQYFASSQGIRITLDTQLSSIPILGNCIQEFKLEASPMDAIVEIKYPEKQNNQVAQILSDMPFALSKNSKYTNAVDGF